MPICNSCSTSIYSQVFGVRHSRFEAHRFRRHGLDRRARRFLEAAATAQPLHGATTLEIGAGIGGLSITLLEQGVAQAMTIDASISAASTAEALALERGVANKMRIEVGDFAARTTDEHFDLVILDRVICCYPDWRALLTPASAATAGAIVLSYPRKTWYMRAFRIIIALTMFVMRKEFRFYIHPAGGIQALLTGAGLDPEVVGRVGPWELLVAKRNQHPG